MKKTNELRDIEIEDLKNQFYSMNQKFEAVINILIDTMGVKNLRKKVLMPVEINEDDFEECSCASEAELMVLEDNEGNKAAFVQGTMRDVLLSLKE